MLYYICSVRTPIQPLFQGFHHMNTINLTLSAINDLKPTTINGIDCDGIVGGRPVNIRRNRYDGVVPAIGSTVPTTYGTARVVGYVEGSLKVRIVEFNEDYEFETLDIENPDILTAEECVESLSRCANMGIESFERDLRRIFATVEGNVSKEGRRYIANLDSFAPNEFRMNFTDKAQLPEDTEVLVDYVYSYLVEKETPIERAKRIAEETRKAQELADELLGADVADIPADVLAEMAMEFGEF